MQVTGKNISLKVNDIVLCYDDFGTGNIPVLFIHGFPFDKSMWQPQLDFLQSTNRVIAFDIRGFGKSTTDEQEVSIEVFADDLIQLMDALMINKAVVCGLSMGGYIALNAIARFPERFAKLILCDTQCIADSPEGKEKRYKTIQHIESGGLNDFAEVFLKNIFFKDSFIDKKESVEKIKNTILSTSPKSITSTLKALAERNETCSILNSISAPTLILCGKEDVVTPPAQSEFLNRSIKNSRLQTIDHAGHLSNLEQADRFNKYLINFLSENP